MTFLTLTALNGPRRTYTIEVRAASIETMHVCETPGYGDDVHSYTVLQLASGRVNVTESPEQILELIEKENTHG
jgi:hypothetical protein